MHALCIAEYWFAGDIVIWLVNSLAPLLFLIVSACLFSSSKINTLMAISYAVSKPSVFSAVDCDALKQVMKGNAKPIFLFFSYAMLR